MKPEDGLWLAYSWDKLNVSLNAAHETAARMLPFANAVHRVHDDLH